MLAQLHNRVNLAHSVLKLPIHVPSDSILHGAAANKVLHAPHSRNNFLQLN